MKQIVKKGATSNLFCIFIQDSSSTTGAGLTGLTSGSSGLVCYRARADDGNAGGTAISLSAGTKGTWSSGGFVEKDATNMPGVYELGVPDAVFATGSNYGIVMLKGATNMAPVVMEFELTSFDLMTATQKVDVDTIKTNPVVNAGTITFPTTATLASTTNITAGTITTASNLTTNNDKTGYGISAAAVSSIWQDTTASDFTTALSVGKSIMNGVSLGTGLTINGYTGNTPQTGDNYARTGAPAGASVSADIAAVKVDTAAVKVQTDKLTFTVANKVDANMLATNGDATAAANVAKTTRAIVRCTASGVPTTTSIPTSACAPSGAVADQFKGRIVTFDADTTTTALRGQSTDITASSNSATPTFTVTALTTAPASGDTFSIT